MFRIEYAELLEDDQGEARERERTAFNRSVVLMEIADSSTATPVDVANAIVFTTKLWTALIEDLSDSGNGLPKVLRAQIISIGIWILRELDNIRNGKSENFEDVKAVSMSIHDGLL